MSPMARAFAVAGSTGGRMARGLARSASVRGPAIPVTGKPVRALEPPDRSFGEHAITAIDRTWRIAGRRQAALQRTHHILAAGLIACPRA